MVAVSKAPDERVCGPCSLCCTVLRVDELRKLGGTPCAQLAPGGGCAIHDTRPQVCRAYRCAWLEGKFRDEDRPDRLEAVVDFAPRGGGSELVIVQAREGVFDASARLQEIAEAYRELMPVRISDTQEIEDPDRPFRVLLAGGEERRVRGEQIERLRGGESLGVERLPWLERMARRLLVAWRRRKVRGAR